MDLALWRGLQEDFEVWQGGNYQDRTRADSCRWSDLLFIGILHAAGLS